MDEIQYLFHNYVLWKCVENLKDSFTYLELIKLYQLIYVLET